MVCSQQSNQCPARAWDQARPPAAWPAPWLALLARSGTATIGIVNCQRCLKQL